MQKRVAIVGASNKPDRYAFRAMQMLLEHDHQVFLVHPRVTEINGVKVYSSLNQLSQIDTVTMYVREELSQTMEQDLRALKPKRVIFNPGAENPSLAKNLEDQGVEVVQACTLVMLSLGQF